jgi:hypothetical protein
MAALKAYCHETHDVSMPHFLSPVIMPAIGNNPYIIGKNDLSKNAL